VTHTGKEFSRLDALTALQTLQRDLRLRLLKTKQPFKK
jgi:hypothetical protein